MEYLIATSDDEIVVRPQGRLQQQVMGEDIVEMNFVLREFVAIPIGSTTEVFGAVYYLFDNAEVTQISTKEWHYSLDFKAVKYHLANVSMLFYDSQNMLRETDFHIHGTADEILNIIITNANRANSGWTKGSVKTTTPKLVHFSKTNCLEALATIAEVFELEYKVDSDKTIHLGLTEVVSVIKLEYGSNKGIISIAEQAIETEFFTRLYAQGSNKNLPATYRSNRLQLPSFPNYIEGNVAKYGLREHIEIFEDIYPHRVGTVTSVDANNIMKFSDSAIDFDLNERDQDGNTIILMPNLSAKVVFQTGQLAGYRFEIAENGYNSTEKSFIILKNQDEKDLELPSENLKPAVGDTYILEDIQMPAAYVSAAETKLRSSAIFFLNVNSSPRKEYKVVLDPLFLKRENLAFDLGRRVTITAPDFGLLGTSRITSITTNLIDRYDCQITVSSHNYFAALDVVRQKQYTLAAAIDLQKFKKKVNNNIAESNKIQAGFDEDGFFLAENIKDGTIAEDKLSQDIKNKLEKAENIINDTEVTEETTVSSRKFLEFLRYWGISDYAQRLDNKTPNI